MQPNRGRTIAHRQQELKPRNWAPKVAGFYDLVQLVDLGLNALFSLLKWLQVPVNSVVRRWNTHVLIGGTHG
jgi:hypothetical protein